jgi:hypothetical protein
MSRKGEIFMEILVQHLIEALALVLVGVLAVALRGVVKVGITYLESKIGSEKFNLLKDYTQTIVRYLEQSPVFTELDGTKKKEQAISLITAWAKEHNLPITHELCDQIIEEAVQIVNTELGKPLLAA